MKKNFRIATMVYLIFLGMMLGAVVYAGAVVAPVIFGSEQWLGGEILSRYQEGQIMTQNFVRLGYGLTVMMLAVFLYEGYRYKMGEHDKIVTSVTLIVLATAALFNYYYLPDIVSMQSMGVEAVQSDVFERLHKGSELDVKVMTVAILALMVLNMRKACR